MGKCIEVGKLSNMGHSPNFSLCLLRSYVAVYIFRCMAVGTTIHKFFSGALGMQVSIPALYLFSKTIRERVFKFCIGVEQGPSHSRQHESRCKISKSLHKFYLPHNPP